MVPFIPYFFFISNSIALFPNYQSIPNTLWSLIPFFLFFLLFSNNKKDLFLFFGISLITLIFHVYLAGLTDLLFHFRWDAGTIFINPFLILSIFFLVSLLIACLLYTSDAADEEDSVDLGGRRIIKKKKKSIS